MSIKTSIVNTIRRLNLHGIIMKLPIFGQALYEGIAEELDRVNDFRGIVNSSVVPNVNMDTDTIEDNEQKYGIDPDITATDEERILRIIEAAQRDGNGGPDWLEDQIRKAGYDLYVILNEKTVSAVPQFGNHQFGQIQFGGSITYTDPRTVDGKLIVSSPNGHTGGQYQNFGTVQFGTFQFGALQANWAFPRPREFKITSNPDRWGYFFFLSPFPDRLALSSELLQITEEELTFLKKLVIKLKHVRNWAIAQVEVP